MIDKKLLDILVCTKCKGDLVYKDSLECRKCRLKYAVHNGIPDMIPEHAEKLL